MTKLSAQVREFMVAFDQPIRSSPGVPTDDVVRLRARLIAEEFCELIESLYRGPIEDFEALRVHVMALVSENHIRVNLPAFADACADVDYVIEGARLAFGIDGEPVADAVHASNLQKVGGYVDEHGKWRKPANWKAPDIAGCLRAQGWGIR